MDKEKMGVNVLFDSEILCLVLGVYLMFLIFFFEVCWRIIFYVICCRIVKVDWSCDIS